MNSIVVLNYNNWKETKEYIEKVALYSIINYLIVVDNASTDGSFDHLKTLEAEKIKVIASTYNGGYNYGNNIGIRYSIFELKCTNIIISNPDIEVTEESLKIIINDLNSNEYGVVAPVVFNMGGKIQSNCGWNLPTYRQLLMNCCLLTYKIQKIMGVSNYFSVEKNPKQMVTVEVVSGCFFGITAKAYTSIGGFDEDIFLYGEEVMLGAALKQNNIKCIIDKNCSVIHADRGGEFEDIQRWKKHMKYIYKSSMVYIAKVLHCNKLKSLLFAIWYWIGAYVNRLLLKIKGC